MSTTADLPAQLDRDGWDMLRAQFTATFAERTRDEWAKVFNDVDACVTPVLSWTEAASDPHLVARGTLPTYGDVTQAARAALRVKSAGRQLVEPRRVSPA